MANGPALFATTSPLFCQIADAVAFSLNVMLPTTTMYLSNVTFHPSMNCGSPGVTGLNGKPFSPSVSPEIVTSMVFGVFGAVAVKPGSNVSGSGQSFVASAHGAPPGPASGPPLLFGGQPAAKSEIGRASCRERV